MAGSLDKMHMRLGTRRRSRLHEAGPQDELERKALAAIQTLRADRASDQLRANVERLKRQSRPAAGRPGLGRRPLILAVPAGAIVAIVLALALALPSGTPGSPSVGLAAQLALRGAALAGPAPDPSAPASQLDQSVGGISFPNWSRLGWHAAGWRVDRLNGQRAITVYYATAGHRIAYTILAMPALRWPKATTTTYAQTRFATLHMSRRVVVTWRRGGHTCILSGAGVANGQLLALATWDLQGQDPPAVPAY